MCEGAQWFLKTKQIMSAKVSLENIQGRILLTRLLLGFREVPPALIVEL